MITIQNLCKKFEDKVLFDNFNCSIPDSGFVVFCGESGCGKTTLLNMIGCLERPDSGTIIIDGIDIWRIKKKRELFSDKLGFLFQNFALLEGKTVAQNLQIIQKKTRTETSVAAALEAVGLAKKANTKVYKLSGGEQQRVALDTGMGIRILESGCCRFNYHRSIICSWTEPWRCVRPENTYVGRKAAWKIKKYYYRLRTYR